MAEINTALNTIRQYLELKGETKFRIPEYQRAYSWGIDQCDALWQDIWNYIEEIKNINKDGNGKEKKFKDSYFFGTIIINGPKIDKNGVEILELIDGQQRTTTFLLMLKALLMRINYSINNIHSGDDVSEALRGKLQKHRDTIMLILSNKTGDDYVTPEPRQDKDKIFWENTEVIENESIKEEHDNKNELKTILHSWDFNEAEKNVRHKKGCRLDYKYTNYFRNFKFFYNKFFGTQSDKDNQTTLSLDSADINNFAFNLLEKCVVIVIKSQNDEQAIAMFNSLNSAGQRLSDTDIISAKLFAYAEKSGLLEDYKTKWEELQYYTTDSIVDIDAILMQHMYYKRAKNRDIGEDGSNLTTPGLRRYYTSTTSNGSNLLKEPIVFCTDLINLAKIWKKVSTFPIIQVLLRFNGNAKLFLASYFYRFNGDSIEQEDIEPIAECFLRLFSLLELVETGFSSRFFKAFLFKESIQLVEADTPNEKIIADFDKKINEIKEAFKPENIKDNAKGPCSSALVCLNEYLLAKETGKVCEFKLNENTQVEHIMPKATKNSKQVMDDVGITSNEEFKSFVDQLGNLILLESSLNQSISADWFKCKLNNGYKKSCYPRANELVQEYEKTDKRFWGKEEIEEATEIAVERILNFIYNK